MSFFQTVILFLGLSYGFGYAIERLLPNKIDSLKNMFYYFLAFIFLIFICWSVIQLIFGIPSISTVISLEAALLGLLFALGIKAAYTLLRDRAKLKKMGK